LLFSIFLHNSEQKLKLFATHAVLVLRGTTKVCMQGNEGHVTGVFSYDIVNCGGCCQAEVSCTENLYFSRTAITA